MRTTFIGFMLLLLLATSSVFAEEEYNFLKQGYSFFDTVPDGYGGACGLLEPNQTQNPPIDFDYVNYEVSWVYEDMLITSYEEIGILRVWTLSGGTIGIYEDDSPDLDYGDDPVTGIATASDGTPALTGVISTAAFTFNVMSETGTFSGFFEWTGGSRLAEIGNLAESVWSIFHPASSDDAVNVPDGYHSRFPGRIYAEGETATASSSWSQVRSLY